MRSARVFVSEFGEGETVARSATFSPTAQKSFCGDSGDFSPLARAAARELGAHKLKTAAAAKPTDWNKI